MAQEPPTVYVYGETMLTAQAIRHAISTAKPGSFLTLCSDVVPDALALVEAALAARPAPLAPAERAAVLLALFFPGSALHPTASPWLPLHLALGIACYGLFAAAVVHAWLMTRAEHHIRQAEDPQSGIPLLTLERLTFRFVTAGFVLLTATLLAGWLFGETLYGHPGRWDHKAVFSLLSWVTFATLLLGRARFGWRGRNAVRILYAGAGLLLLAYVGSRFVMEVVLGRST